MLRKTVSIILALFFLTAVGASADEGDDVAKKVQGFYDKAQTYQANFTQVAYRKMSRRKMENAGAVWFKKPGKMRWKYTKPENQQIYIDGDHIWFYKPEKREAVQAKAQGVFEGDAPLNFLAGFGKLSQSFDYKLIKSKDVDEKKFALLKLSPKKKTSQAEIIKIKVIRETGEVVKVSIFDFMGNENKITFTDVKTDIELDEALFKFTPPPGVRIVEANK